MASKDILRHQKKVKQDIIDYQQDEFKDLDVNIQQMIEEEQQMKATNPMYEEILRQVEMPSTQSVNSQKQTKVPLSIKKFQENYPVQNMPESMQIGTDYYNSLIQ